MPVSFQPPMMASAAFGMFGNKWRPFPNGSSYVPAMVSRCRGWLLFRYCRLFWYVSSSFRPVVWAFSLMYTYANEEVPALAEGLLRLELERVIALCGAQLADFAQPAILRVLSQQRRQGYGLLVAQRSREERRSQVVVERDCRP